MSEPAEDVDDAHIRAVLGDTFATLTSLLAAMTLNEDPTVIEAWVNRAYDHVRQGLTDEQRIRAILLLIQPEATERVKQLLSDDIAEASR